MITQGGVGGVRIDATRPKGAAPPVGGVTVLSWADDALMRSQIHDAFDSVVMRAVLLPGVGDKAQMPILKQ